MEERLNQALTKFRKVLARKDILLAIVVAVSLIGVGVYIGWYNNKVVPLNSAATARYTLDPSNHLSFMSNWDGPDYIRIARQGYQVPANANFFPLYPILIHALNWVMHSALDSALAISWVSLVGAIYFYIKIVKRLFKLEKNHDLEVVRGLMLFLLFPTAVFMLATYTESLFAFLALASIYFALSKKYLAVMPFLLFCTATHLTGIFVLVLVGLIMLEENMGFIKSAATVAVGSLGLIGYMYYLWRAFDKPLAFISSQKHGHGWLSNGYLNLISSIDPFNLVFILFLVIAMVYWWNKRKSFSIYSFLFLLIPGIGKQYGGFNRYVLMAFPIPLMFYGFLKDKRTLYTVFIAATTVAWTYFMLQYAGGYVGG